MRTDSVSYSTLKQWMTTCSGQYGCGPKTGKLNTPVPFFLINCNTREILQYKSKKRVQYVALSYVWGANAEDVTPTKDFDRLPAVCCAVIEDAILVTVGLGFSYLWVDRYCVSSESSSRHQQIARMDWVYKQSELTSIAISGPDSRQGLAGVSNSFRYDQNHLRIGGHAYISTLPSLKSVLEMSIYETRGWTYQEKFFSARQLFFTPYQVYYRCVKQTVHEAMDVATNSFSSHRLHIRQKTARELQDKYLQSSHLPSWYIRYEPDGRHTSTQIMSR